MEYFICHPPFSWIIILSTLLRSILYILTEYRMRLETGTEYVLSGWHHTKRSQKILSHCLDRVQRKNRSWKFILSTLNVEVFELQIRELHYYLQTPYMCMTRPSFFCMFWYGGLSVSFQLKRSVYAPIHLLKWQQVRPLGTFLHDRAILQSCITDSCLRFLSVKQFLQLHMFIMDIVNSCVCRGVLQICWPTLYCVITEDAAW